MTPQEQENCRRAIARKCYHELDANRPLNDDKRRTILQKHIREFTLLLNAEQLRKTIPALWLNVYVMMLDKEVRNG